jgi:hypothetical protein
MSMESYLNAYLDRRMKFIIDEWGLTTRRDIASFQRRLKSLEREIDPIKEFEQAAADKLTELETRLKTVQEAKK